MQNIHFTDDEIEQVLDCVVAVLNLGNVDFGLIEVTGGDFVASPSLETKDYLMTACKLLQIDLKMLIHSMTKMRVTIHNEVIETKLDLDAAY